ncbi:MAG: hypothetical protein DI552_05895 [Brevundimonas sp.]|uniref:YidB family protein n=1 Tax=Brevundimonas albigilva TaxID=1312364 RepID=A0ABY4SKT9_9CAUL|nr:MULTISPECIES: YidB family protein [Brevundimonas]PZU59424.1 MAG: hypothetical protein DI552_05895 [Brevundimonas sp.]UQV17305.1 YidB family protein [Brevundimonas albigilva]URI14863.1 YidB family protein [Brevundimonas albigilva]
MGFLDTVLNGLGDDAAGGLGDLLKMQGGVGGLAEKFGQAGLGDVVGSWIGQGANAGISAEQIAAVLGSGPLADFAQKLGVSPQQASETLAGLLPEAIDRLTPGGQVDGADDLLSKLPGGVGDMIGGFLKR